jgi:malonyl-ACP O-methyltransferase BioC
MLNKKIVKNSFARSHGTYHNSAVVQQQMAVRLATNVADRQKHFKRVLELGVGTGLLTEQLIKRVKIETLFCNDLMDSSRFIHSPCQFIVGDAEEVIYPHHLDLVVSNAVVQWFTKLPEFFQKVSAHLQPTGLLAFTSFGPHNFKELRQVTGQGLDYYSLDELVDLLAPDFELLVADESHQVLTFPGVRELLGHLKETGVNGLNSQALTKTKYRQLLNDYPCENGVASLTYHPLIILARKR